jgi:mono/diheme cytochrome c family protein
MQHKRHIRFLPRVCTALLIVAWQGNLHADEAPDLSGAQLYQDFCAMCHGSNAHGSNPGGQALNAKVPDLTLLAAHNHGVFPAEEVHRIIDGRSIRTGHGTRQMPVWGSEFYGYEGEDATRRARVAHLIDQLVEYLRTVQRGMPQPSQSRE